MQTPPFISLLRTIFLPAVTALLITSAALPMPAQNSGPASAVQAARMPQYASRLARPATRPASRPNLRSGSRSGSPQEGDPIYDNGPINGTVYAWTINFGFVISDSFTITGATDVSGMIFGAWLTPGDVLESAEISVTSSPNGGTSYFDQTVSFTQSGCVLNGDGFNVCIETSAGFTSPTLPPGTYWVNLQNAQVNTGDPVYWDQNNGPSQAYDNNVGTIPSESFTLLGDNGTDPCFGSQGKLQVIYNFTQQQGNGDGVTIDSRGNLYGTTSNGGANSDGLAFKLAHLGGWLFDPLFNFLGGSTGGQPTGVIVGPNGSLYGGAAGGIANCGTNGSQYCGLVFNLRPPPTACANALCGWNENIPYRFSNENDGFGTINVSASDQQGNLYGTTTAGGADNQGIVFQLTPSGNGWTKTTLYSFTGASDGTYPTQVVAGSDGNLYGVAYGGVSNAGVVFQLKLSGNQWVETTLHAFSGGGIDGSDPAYLVQEQRGQPLRHSGQMDFRTGKNIFRLCLQ